MNYLRIYRHEVKRSKFSVKIFPRSSQQAYQQDIKELNICDSIRKNRYQHINNEIIIINFK